MMQVLRNEFGLKEVDDAEDIERLGKLCMVALRQAADALLPLNAWLAAVRQEEAEKARTSSLLLGGASATDFVCVSLSGTTLIVEECDFGSHFGVPDPDLEARQIWEDHIRVAPLERERGKFLLDAMRCLLAELQGDRRKTKDRRYFTRRGPAPLQLSKANLISELSQYADTPAELRQFLLQYAV